MMKYIKFCFIIFSLLLVQAKCSPYEESDSDENVVVATAGMKIIEIIVNVATSFSMTLIQEVSKNVSVIEQKINNVEKALIDFVWNVVLNNLNEMEKDPDSTDFAKATILCVKQHDDYIKSLVFNFSSQSTICEVEKMVTTLNTFLPALQHIYDTNEEIKKLTQELDKCSNDNDAACIEKVNEEIDEELTAIKETLGQDIADASKLIENFERFAALCHQDATTKLQESSQELSNLISECIQEQINAST